MMLQSSSLSLSESQGCACTKMVVLKTSKKNKKIASVNFKSWSNEFKPGNIYLAPYIGRHEKVLKNLEGPLQENVSFQVSN